MLSEHGITPARFRKEFTYRDFRCLVVHRARAAVARYHAEWRDAGF